MVNLGGMRTWVGWVMFFFAWAFVIHGALLLLHEVGGHGVAGTIFGCGIDRFDLTYFGHGVTFHMPCPNRTWIWTRRMIIESAGLAATIGAGAITMALQRRAGLAPLTRLLLALLATWFLLDQLAYATAGGFHNVEDPALVAVTLASYGLHVLAWLPPLVIFAAAAAFGGRAIVDAFREHFGSRSRLHALKQMTAVLGTAGLLYFVAFSVERTARIEAARIETDIPPSVSVEAEQRAADLGRAPPFPIHRVLFAIAIVAFAIALARPVVRCERVQDSARSIPPRHAISVAVATLVSFVVITLLTHVRAAQWHLSTAGPSFRGCKVWSGVDAPDSTTEGETA